MLSLQLAAHAAAAPLSRRSSPLACLPCPSKASTVARFCPLLFKRRGGGSRADAGSAAAPAAAGAPQPYRLVLAVATLDSVLLYDVEVRRYRCTVHACHQLWQHALLLPGSCASS